MGKTSFCRVFLSLNSQRARWWGSGVKGARCATMRFIMRLSVGFLCLLTGCVLFVDFSVQARHNWWLEDQHKLVAQNPNIYAPYWANKNKNEFFMGSKTLPNGNIEDQYYYGVLREKGKCLYFYEYEPKSGLIVNFRFKEKKKYDCRATGA